MTENISPTTTLQIARHLMIAGRVQGVYYRASLQAEADRLGVTGWCRNTAEGQVEAFLLGEARAMEDLIAWAHRGPENAQVSDVVVSPRDNDHENLGERFEIRA